MNELKELLNEGFELHAQMAWLKTIDKAIKKRDKLKQKFIRQNYVVTKLVEAYNERYKQ